jgi:hypothetical protein
MWTKLVDGSIVDDKGRVMFFSTERFVRDICCGNCCFICGSSPDAVQFNDEHVIPEWLLRKFNLFAKSITLPNGHRTRYDRYKVPCCVDCNSLLGRTIEEEVSAASRDGVRSMSKYVDGGGGRTLFLWLALIFLKTHLKDREFRLHLDMRQGQERISEAYEWEPLHHIHTLVRSIYTGAAIDAEAIGSMIVLQSQVFEDTDSFDYGDLYFEQVCCIKLGDIGVATVFDDSNGALSMFYPRLERFTGPVSDIQLREVMVELAFLNMHIKERARFATHIDLETEELRIVAFRPPQVVLSDMDYAMRGSMLMYAVKDFVPAIRVPGATREEIEAAILEGKFTFLFDDEGKFVQHSMERIMSPERDERT